MLFFKWIKKLFRPKPIEQPVERQYYVTYIVDGNFSVEYTWTCYANSEVMARYYFWDSHNGLYHDILTVKVCE